MVSFLNCGPKRGLSWARTAISQKRYLQTEQVTNMVILTPRMGPLGMKQGHQEADEAPEHAHHDEGRGEAGIRHGCCGRCQSLPRRLTRGNFLK